MTKLATFNFFYNFLWNITFLNIFCCCIQNRIYFWTNFPVSNKMKHIFEKNCFFVFIFILFIIIFFLLILGFDLSFQLPQLSGRIVGGEDAKIKDVPYQLSLWYLKDFICGASIIHAKWSITAAHCLSIKYESCKISI